MALTTTDEHNNNLNESTTLPVENTTSIDEETIDLFVQPTRTPLELEFQRFLKHKRSFIMLKNIEDFPAWFEQLENNLNYLGLPGAASRLLDAKSKGKSMKLKQDQEYVVKELIAISTDNTKLIKMQGAKAQEDLYSIVHGLGFIKNSDEVLRLVNEFKIDVRDNVEMSLRKWSILNSIQKYSELEYTPKLIIAGIGNNFPKDISYQPLIKIINKHKKMEYTPDVVRVIKELHEEIDELTSIRSPELTFAMSNLNMDDADKEVVDFKEEMKVQAIMNKNSTRSNKRANKYRIHKENGSIRSKIVPKGCRYCGDEDHASQSCPNNRPGICWGCGKKGHVRDNCVTWKYKQAAKTINALLADDISRAAVMAITRRDDDSITSANVGDQNNIYNGIVLDTGAQASVTGSSNNLHSYLPLSEFDQNNIRSVTNTPIKVLGYGILRLKLDFSNPKTVDILVYHCSNIQGTFLSDDDLTDYGIDYRSINGVPFLCWKDEKIQLIKGDKLVYIPPKMFSFENKRVAGIHEALGHVDRAIAEKSVAEGFAQVDISELNNMEKEKCLACQIGKAKRCNHRTGSREKYIIPIPLRMFHADLMYINVNDNDKEPLEDTDFTTFKWVLAFTDDYSKMCYAFPLRKKSDFLFHFIRLYNYIKTTFNTTIAVLHTDQGSEFINKTARGVYDAMGITHLTTNGYASMENGVAERRNLTIKNDIRTNLVASKLDYALWPIVMEYVVTVRNKLILTDKNKSPEAIIIDYFLPECELTEIYPHKFKSFGRHGIWYDAGSKQPSLMRTGIHCFYLGPSQYPCASDGRVLNGDKVLAFIPLTDGYYKPIIKHTTNVNYNSPVGLLKDVNLNDLGIRIQPIDTHKDVQPTPIPNQLAEKGDNTLNLQSYKKTPMKSNDVRKDNSQSNNMPLSSMKNDQTQNNAQNDVHMMNAQSTEAKGGVKASPNTGCDTTDKDIEMKDYVIEENSGHEDKFQNETFKTDTTELINADESELGEDNSHDEEIEEVSREDVDRLKSYERVVKEGNVDDIIEANKDNMVEVAVDKELQDYFNPNKTVTLPEGRLLRSRYQIKGINSVKFVPNFSMRPGELPNPKRIIYQSVCKDKEEGHEWVAAFNNELNSHKQNGSWDFRPIITSDPEVLKRTVKLDVICTEKRAAVGERPKKKVRFVLRGDRQDESTYSNTYSPTLPYDLLRIILAECVQSKRHSVFLDISTAYLNADIDHDIYVELPSVIEENKPAVRLGEKVVHKVKRAIYGLKQSGRLWYLRLTKFLISIGFERRGDIPCVLIKPMKGNPKRISIIVGFFVDDMVVTGISKYEVDRFVESLKDEFNLRITNPDNNGYRDILGINVKENRDKRSNVLLSMDLAMDNYIKKMIIKLGFEKDFKKSRKISTPMTPNFQFDKEAESELVMPGEQLAQEIHWFREVVGCLQYLANALRPDIAYSANYMARFCMYPHPKLKTELVRILRYAYQTREYKIRYTRFTSDVEHLKGGLITYSDADYAGDLGTRKSTLASIFMMNGGPVAWFARVAKFAATSSTDAEVAAMVESGNGVTYYREVLSFMKVISDAYSRKREYESYNINSGGESDEQVKLDPLIIFVDNISAIYLAQKGVTNNRTKHMAVRVARANEIMERENITFRHIGTKAMLADILTKPVTAEVMNTLIRRILVSDTHVVKNI